MDGELLRSRRRHLALRPRRTEDRRRHCGSASERGRRALPARLTPASPIRGRAQTPPRDPPDQAEATDGYIRWYTADLSERRGRPAKKDLPTLQVGGFSATVDACAWE